MTTEHEVDEIVNDINEGRYDAYLEAILAAAHGRKRVRRGLRSPYGLRVPREDRRSA